MIRVLMFFAVVAVLAFGATWMADHPGSVLVSWGGRDVQFSTLVGLVAVLAFALVLIIAWSLLRFVVNVPSLMSMAGQNRRRQRGLRGLHMEALRDGNADAAFAYASEAQKIAALPWAGQAVLQHRAAQHDWSGALETVDRNAAGRLVDRPTANRQRAVLQTAIALDCEARAGDEALRLAREALRVAPTLVPAAALAGRLLSRRGDFRKASRIIETAFAATPHPDLAEAYVAMRQGDSALDRLTRAEMLAKQAPGQPESRLMVARSALEAREFARARQVMAPLVNGEEGSRPTVRACLMMADIEEIENGPSGTLFEWLQRAARARHDPAWIADGMISDTWAPVSPVTGRIDAFVWDTPKEQMTPSEHRRVIAHERRFERDDALPLSGPPPRLDRPANALGEGAGMGVPAVVTPGPVNLDPERDTAPANRRRATQTVGAFRMAAPDDPGLAPDPRPASSYRGGDGLGGDLGEGLSPGRV